MRPARPFVVQRTRPRPHRRPRCAARRGVDQVAPFGATLHVVGTDPKALEAALAAVARAQGVTRRRGETSLEDVFIQFMGGAKDNMA